MNKGLKNYTKQLTQTIGDVQVSVNINENDANLIISAPLIDTVGLSPISTSLIYNHQKRNQMFLLGYGLNLNYYAKIIEDSSSRFRVVNADFTEDLYLEENEFKNKETGLTLTKTYDDEYELNYHIKLEDKQGNFREYSSSNLEYPSLIVMKNGDRYTLDFTSSIKTISNNKGDLVKIYEIGPDDFTIEYYHNNQLVDSKGLRHYNYEIESLYKLVLGTTNIKSNIEFGIFDDRVTIKDTITRYRVKYTLNNNKVVTIQDGYDDNFTNGNITTITYEGKKTTITDKFNNRAYVFFDNNDFPLFEMDDKGNVVETEYDKDTNALKSKSSTIQTKHKLPNLLTSENIANIASISNISISNAGTMNTFFSGFLADSVKKYSTSNGGTLTIIKELDILSTDNISLVLWGRQLTACDDNNYVEVKLIFDYYQTVTKKFDKKVVDSNFDLITLGLSATKSYSHVQVIINFVGNASIELGGLQLLRKEFGSFYNYDSNGNATEFGNSGNSASFTYNSNNLPTSSLGVDSTKYDYGYDNHGNLTQVKTAYGVKITNEYDTTYPSNLKKNIIYSGNELVRLKTEKTYTSDGRFLSSEMDGVNTENINS